ncbi:MAG: hypothetical protein ACOH2M_16180 [Cypionkella sp.]
MTAREPNAQHLARSADAPERFSPSDKFTQQGQKERLAEPANRRLWFQIKRLSDDIGVVLVEDDPNSEVCVEASATLLDRWHLRGEPRNLWLLGGDGKQDDQIAFWTRWPNANRYRPTPSSLGFSAVFSRAHMARVVLTSGSATSALANATLWNPLRSRSIAIAAVSVADAEIRPRLWRDRCAWLSWPGCRTIGADIAQTRQRMAAAKTSGLGVPSVKKVSVICAPCGGVRGEAGLA